MEEVPSVGDVVLARREPDLEPERACVRSTQRDASGCATCAVRFEDGFMLKGVPVAALTADTKETPTDEVAAANRAAVALLAADSPAAEWDGYDDAVLPLVPTLPITVNNPAKKAELVAFALRYKEVGNELFKEGRYAWATRTYLVGVQLLQRLGFRDPAEMFYDGASSGVGISCLSNAALCALKLQRYELAGQLCDRGLQFSPEGADLAKLLLRKAQSWLERPEHADPDLSTTLLEQAQRAHSSRAVLEMLQRAKRAVREKQRAADRALFSGRGFGSARLASDDTARADARRECERLLRRGAAALLGTLAWRENVAPEMMDALGIETPTREPQKARVDFADALERARAAGLRVEEAHALFWRGAAASELEMWHEASSDLVAYFDLAKELHGAAEGGGARAAEPQLGAAYARFHAGAAFYNQRMVAQAIDQFREYLVAAGEQRDMQLCTVDEWGNEVVTALDKELTRIRRWIVAGRNEYKVREPCPCAPHSHADLRGRSASSSLRTCAHCHHQSRAHPHPDPTLTPPSPHPRSHRMAHYLPTQARRMLAFLLQRSACDNGLSPEQICAALTDAAQHLRASLELAWEPEQRQEASDEIDKVQHALQRFGAPMEAAGQPDGAVAAHDEAASRAQPPAEAHKDEAVEEQGARPSVVV